MGGLLIAIALATMPFCKSQNITSSSNQSFVWKPVGAHFEDAVIVLPRYYTGTKTKVEVFGIKGKKLTDARLKSTGLCEGVAECLFRQTFLAGHSGAEFQRRHKSVMVRVTAPNRECRSYEIKRPAHRAQYR